MGRRSSSIVAAAAGVTLLLGSVVPVFILPNPHGLTISNGPQRSFGASWTSGSLGAGSGALSAGILIGALSAVAALARARCAVVARAVSSDVEEGRSRREVLVPGVAALSFLGASAAEAQAPPPAEKPKVDVPDRINADPYELIGMEKPEDRVEDYKTFYMKKNYRNDSYQVLKHMKISASLDKGSPKMEQWNTRVKEEMNDWLALYRRQDNVKGRQSYYSLYSAVNTLASHFTSYGAKFPFPNKRRPRFFELTTNTEKFLEKGK